MVNFIAHTHHKHIVYIYILLLAYYGKNNLR